MRWDTPLREEKWIPSQRLRQLERFGITTAGDLLSHFPRRWEDRNRFDRFPHDESDSAVCICGIVQTASVRRLPGRARMFEALLVEENPHALSGRITVRWFNLYWVEKVVAAGHRLVVYGKPKRRGRQIVMDQPEFEVVDDDAEKSIHLERITPIHRATEGLSTKALRWLTWECLQRLDTSSVVQAVPCSLDATPRIEALRHIHFPDSFDHLRAARTHLVLTEFFAIQLCLAMRRA